MYVYIYIYICIYVQQLMNAGRMQARFDNINHSAANTTDKGSGKGDSSGFVMSIAEASSSVPTVTSVCFEPKKKKKTKGKSKGKS